MNLAQTGHGIVSILSCACMRLFRLKLPRLLVAQRWVYF
jgi:hypothetical protein